MAVSNNATIAESFATSSSFNKRNHKMLQHWVNLFMGLSKLNCRTVNPTSQKLNEHVSPVHEGLFETPCIEFRPGG